MNKGGDLARERGRATQATEEWKNSEAFQYTAESLTRRGGQPRNVQGQKIDDALMKCRQITRLLATCTEAADLEVLEKAFKTPGQQMKDLPRPSPKAEQPKVKSYFKQYIAQYAGLATSGIPMG